MQDGFPLQSHMGSIWASCKLVLYVARTEISSSLNFCLHIVLSTVCLVHALLFRMLISQSLSMPYHQDQWARPANGRGNIASPRGDPYQGLPRRSIAIKLSPSCRIGFTNGLSVPQFRILMTMALRHSHPAQCIRRDIPPLREVPPSGPWKTVSALRRELANFCNHSILHAETIGRVLRTRRTLPWLDTEIAPAHPPA